MAQMQLREPILRLQRLIRMLKKLHSALGIADGCSGRQWSSRPSSKTEGGFETPSERLYALPLQGFQAQIRREDFPVPRPRAFQALCLVAQGLLRG